MSGFTLAEWIDATPRQVFDLMTDPAKASDVMPNIQELVPLTDGPIGVGSRLRETRLVNGKPAETELLIQAFEPGSRYAVSTEQSGIEVVYTYTLRPEKQGTRIQLEASVNGGGLKKLMLPVVASIMKREDGNHLAQLKTAVERQA